MKTILCSIDLSSFSSAVLRYGFGFARQFGARLIVYHAIYSADDQVHRSPLFERGGEQDERVNSALETIRILMKKLTVEWEPLVRAGEPVETLRQVAADCRADLVIAASHGLGGLKRLLLGRVVERMVRGLEKPFLVLRGGNALALKDGEWPPPAIHRVLVGCGPNFDDRPALEWGSRIAAGFDAAMTVLHAMESPAPEDTPDAIGGSYTQLEDHWQQRLRERLLRLIPEAAPGRPAVDIVLAQGPPADALLEQAQRQGSDLLVVGVRRQSQIRRVMVGSTTEAALRHSSCPVLAVPEPDPGHGMKPSTSR